MIESEGTRIVQESADDAFRTVIEAEKERQVERAVDFVVALHRMQGHQMTKGERAVLKREALELIEKEEI